MPKGIIYCAHCTVNCKKYIGRTIQDFNKRIKQHYRHSKDKNYLFYRSIRKHGWDNFIWGIIEECNSSDLNEREMYWIKQYNTIDTNFGYNMTRGGEFGIDKEILSEMGKRNGKYVYENGIGIFSYTKEKKIELGKIGAAKAKELGVGICAQSRDEKVKCGRRGGITRGKQLEKSFKLISPNGILFEGKNITQFCNKNNLSITGIWQVLNGKTSNHKGWTSPENNWTPIKDENNKKIKKFKIINPEGNVIEVVNFTKFCKDNNLAKTSLRRLLSGVTKSHKGWTLP